MVVLGVVLALGIIARVGRAFLPFLIATIPLVVSILLVNTFLYPDASDRIVDIGALSPTWSGLEFAVQSALRVIAFAMSVALFGLTTPIDHLVADLERRGLGRRAAFVLAATIRTVPRVVERARLVTDAQRARGLDTQGGLLRRIRGLLPLAGPLLLGALADVEDQAVALESRAFSAPGGRTVLRAFPDGGGQRALRWVLVVGTAIVIVLSVSGALWFVP
jgi:energy-coupling factor transport system permease protein